MKVVSTLVLFVTICVYVTNGQIECLNCQNGASCIVYYLDVNQTIQEYVCICKQGYKGIYCKESTFTECRSFPRLC